MKWEKWTVCNSNGVWIVNISSLRAPCYSEKQIEDIEDLNSRAERLTAHTEMWNQNAQLLILIPIGDH